MLLQPWRIAIVAALVAATFLPRLIGLGQILTVDEPLWQGRAGLFIKSLATLDLAGTMTTAQPGVTTTWVVGATYSRGSLAADQAAIAVAISVLILISTYFFVRLWGFRWGMLAGFVLALDPFFIAHSRVVHTDGLLTAFMFASLTSFLAGVAPLWRNRPVITRYVVASGLFAGAALLTKLFGILLVPVVFFTLLYFLFTRRLSLPRTLFLLAGWGLALIFATYSLWPALWLQHSPVYAYLYEWTFIHAGGTLGADVTNQWWFYIRESFFRITPLTTLLLPFALAALLSRRLRQQKPVMFGSNVVLLLAALFYIITLNISADKSDRYILFGLVSLAVFSLLGLRWLASLPKLHKFIPILLALPVIYLAADVIRLHPYYIAHYNRLYPIEEGHKMGWGEGLEQAAAWIKSRNPNASVVTFYPRVFNYFFPDSAETHRDEFTQDYLIIYRSMFERDPAAPETDLVSRWLGPAAPEPVKVITINGLPYVWIFGQ